MSAFDIQFHRGGVHLPQLNLWLDPHEPKPGPELVFISHAHSDHIGLHREVVLTEPTSRLMRSRLAGSWQETRLPYDRAFAPGNAPVPYEITLLPAGHIFGSAMAWIFDGSQSLLYTGDFKLRAGLSAEACRPRPADILIMETTYGRPMYRFPPAADVMQGVIRFCQEALDNEEIPVLLGYSLGKSQEVLRGLEAAGLPIMLHGTVQKLTAIYEEFGHVFPKHEKYRADLAKGRVLVCPPGVAGSAMLRNLGKTRSAILTGWAVDPGCRFRYQANAAFPLSDHADFSDLLQMVEQVRPRKIYTLHGFAADFAQTLRDMGYDAQALSEQDQLNLGLEFSRPPPPHPRPVAPQATVASAPSSAPAEPVSFERFAQVCSQIAATTKKLEKTRLLSEYFQLLPAGQLSHAATWFTGSPFPSSQNRTLQLGWAVIRDALCRVGGVDQGQFGQVYLKHSDLGETAFEILSSNQPSGSSPSLARVHEMFLQLLASKGPTSKIPVLEKALRQSSPLSGKFFVKILTGDLRIGLKEGLVEESLAKAFGASLDEVKGANLLLGDIGQAAALARSGGLQTVSLVPFRPIKYMLASPEETAADIWARIAEWSVGAAQDPSLPLLPPAPEEGWVENKFDGIRAQVHKVGTRVEIYSRDLKEITTTFPEIAERIRLLPHNLILDGEILAMRGNQPLPYSDLQTRLGRREGDLFLRDEIPVQFVAFDLLWLDARSLLKEPLRLRRQTLGALPATGFHVSDIFPVRSPGQIELAFAAARARGNEGLMVKDPASAYTPGRRGLSWLKLKKALATLDCVVVAAEYGHGKRKAVLSDYTFAVRDEASGELKTIGKAYSGLTDVEIATLTERFLRQTISRKGRHHWVQPDTVLEIAFDMIQPSDRHNSGLAMRFPRIVRLRPDKTASEIDTLATARALVANPSQRAKNAIAARAAGSPARSE